MYLSRVEIDFHDRQKTHELRHLGAFHNWVEQSFPEEVKDKVRSRKLWRVDKINQKTYLLVLSEKQPDKDRLEAYGVPDSFACKNYEHLLDSIRAGQRMRFRIALNPVRSVKTEGRSRGKIYPIYAEEDQREFLLKRAEKHGFSLSDGDVIVVERGMQTLLKEKGRATEFVRAVYEGELVIQDAEAFRNLLINGMGREKAYGFGMMTVIPLG